MEGFDVNQLFINRFKLFERFALSRVATKINTCKTFDYHMLPSYNLDAFSSMEEHLVIEHMQTNSPRKFSKKLDPL